MNLPKIIGLGVVSAAFAAVFGLTFNSFLATHAVSALVWTSIAAALFSLAFVLEVFLIEKFAPMAIIIGASTIAASVWLLPSGIGWPLALAAVVFALVLANTYRVGAFTITNAFKVAFIHLGRPILNNAATAIVLFALIAYFGSITFSDVSSYLENVVNHSVEIAQSFLPEEFQENVPAGQQAELKSQVAQQLYDLTVGRLEGLPRTQQNLILVGAGVVAFFTIRGLLVLANWILIWAGFALFQLLRAFQFFRIELESRSKEVIKL